MLDTVAAGHLSLYGYDRPTSTTLVELAERGIRFDAAQATSSWTLPSHATMFTGRWMHELSVGWLNPLDRDASDAGRVPRAQGYATAGFIANTTYCASDSGLGRGFTHYEDFIFPELTAFKTAVAGQSGPGRRAVDRAACLKAVASFGDRCVPWISLRHASRHDRKGAATVNREFLDWLASRHSRSGRSSRS